MSKGKTVAKWIVGGLVVAIVTLRAVTGLLSGNIFYTNYYDQPLNSFGVLIAVASVLIAGMVLLWRYLKSKVK
jgi:hypothetical protein